MADVGLVEPRTHQSNGKGRSRMREQSELSLALDRRTLVPHDLSFEHIRKPGRLKHRNRTVA